MADRHAEQDFEVLPFGPAEQERVLETVAQWAPARTPSPCKL